jgi:hypothetical protein
MSTLQLNGRSVNVEASPDTPLLWVLRDHLGLTGTKFGGYVIVKSGTLPSADLSSASGELIRLSSTAQRQPR